MTDDDASIVLRPLSDPRLDPLELPDDGRTIIGRSSQADWRIGDEAVSRRHACVDSTDGAHTITDLGSRHGTTVNGRALEKDERTPLRPGDSVSFGAWRCMVERAGLSTTSRTMVEEGRSEIRTLSPATFRGVVQKRLDAMLGTMRQMSAAASREEVAEILVRTVCEGTPCPRVLAVRRVGNAAYETVAASEGAVDTPVSLSLLAAAGSGRVVQLTEPGHGGVTGQSIIDLGVQTAICAGVRVSDEAEWFLYLDTRGDETRLPSDAAAFCSAMADLAGLAIERILASEMATRRRQLEFDLEAARRSQELLLPPRRGGSPGLSYAFEFRPGRHVAGDMFDVVALPDGRSAFFLGDVSGKGAGAGVLMAAAQSLLRSLLVHAGSLANAMSDPPGLDLNHEPALGYIVPLTSSTRLLDLRISVSRLPTPNVTTHAVASSSDLTEPGAEVRFHAFEGSCPYAPQAAIGCIRG